MATKTYLFTNSNTTGNLDLQDGGSVTTATTGTGWNVGANAAGQCHIMVAGSEVSRSSGSWGTTLRPDTSNIPYTASWVSPQISGVFASGNWTVTFGFRSVSRAYLGRLKLAVRVFKDDVPQGNSNPVEVTSARYASAATTANLSTSSDTTLGITFAMPELTLNNQYFFIVVGIEITSAGSNVNEDMDFRVGSALGYAVATTDFSSNITLNLTGQPLPSVAGNLGPAAAFTATGISVPIATGTLVYQVITDITLNLTGEAVPVVAGTLAKSFDKTLGGEPIPLTSGTLGPQLSKTLTGVAHVFTSGLVAPAFDFSVVGVAVPGTAGNLASAFDVALLGASVPLSTGTIVYQESGGGDITLTLTGSAAGVVAGGMAPVVAVTVQGVALPVASGVLGLEASRTLVGAVAPLALGVLGPGVALGLAGAVCSAVPGILTPVLSRTLAGVSVGVVAGNLSPAAALALVGLAAAVVTGTVTYQAGQDVTIQLGGTAVPMTPGTLLPSSTLLLPGSSVPAVAGVLLAQIARALQGIPLTTAAGQLLHEHGITLTGQSIPLQSGTMGPGITLVLTGEFAQTALGQLIVEGLLASNSHYIIEAEAQDTSIDAPDRNEVVSAPARNRRVQ